MKDEISPIDYIMKKAIVIGASSGIGEGMARLLASKGYLVGITGRRGELLNKIASEYPGKMVVKVFDNTDFDNLEKNIGELVESLGGLDLLFLSSGTGQRNPDLEYKYEKMTIDVNVNAFAIIAVWSYRFFEKQGYGHFLSVSSVAGTRGNRFAPSYSATKAFQMSFMEGLIQKSYSSKAKIYITDVRPGYVDTAMGHGEGSFWIAPVEKTCKQIYKRAVLNRHNVVYVTKRWRLVAFLFRYVPTFIYKRL